MSQDQIRAIFGSIITEPVIFFDLETTGLDISKDRIVEMTVIKYEPEHGSLEIKTARFNPTIPIPKSASDIHGVTDEMVKDEPTFAKKAKSLRSYFGDYAICGFNISGFDIAILIEEFMRCEVFDFPSTKKIIDSSVIFKKKEERTLSAALKFYCQGELENAHNSEADTLATIDVLAGQLSKYPDLNSFDKIIEFSKFNPNAIGYENKLIRNEKGDITYNFGKSKGKTIKEDPGFALWVLGKEGFSMQLKDILKKELNGKGN